MMPPKVYHRKSRNKNSARCLVKCGCCGERLEIYYDKEPDPTAGYLEINGVLASKEEWRKILNPLLK